MQKLVSPIRESETTSKAKPAVVVKDDSSSNSAAHSDFQVLQRLRGQIEKHRKDLKAKDAELQAKSLEMDNVSFYT